MSLEQFDENSIEFPTPHEMRVERIQILEPQIQEILVFIRANLRQGVSLPVTNKEWDEIAVQEAMTRIRKKGWCASYTKDSGHGATYRFSVRESDE
jgi:hypothetical protein